MENDERIDKTVKALLVIAFENLSHLQHVLDESVKVHTALHRAMCEIHPGFDAVYGRHYDQLHKGPIGQMNRERYAEMQKLIEDLKQWPEA